MRSEPIQETPHHRSQQHAERNGLSPKIRRGNLESPTHLAKQTSHPNTGRRPKMPSTSLQILTKWSTMGATDRPYRSPRTKFHIDRRCLRKGNRSADTTSKDMVHPTIQQTSLRPNCGRRGPHQQLRVYRHPHLLHNGAGKVQSKPIELPAITDTVGVRR